MKSKWTRSSTPSFFSCSTTVPWLDLKQCEQVGSQGTLNVKPIHLTSVSPDRFAPACRFSYALSVYRR